MDLNGEKTLALPCASVWQALNDPDILIQCVPGCESFKRIDEQSFEVILTASVGPIKARFNGQLSLSDINPPHGYTLNFSGSGGAAGMGKGTAVVALTPQESGTELSYKVKAHVSGRLAQVGSRLIDGVAAKMADEFFTKLIKVLSVSNDLDTSPVPSEADSGKQTEASLRTNKSAKSWVLAVVATVLAAGVTLLLR